QLQPPIEQPDWQPWELAAMEPMLSSAVVGSRDTVRAGITEFIRLTGIDELIVTAQIHDHAARLRSFEMVSQIRDE
ncbi:MAG: LLM class flavin-dependent oxidoreductase, partial [Gemmatimonadota bacterium]